MKCSKVLLLFIFLTLQSNSLLAQEINGYRIINVTLQTFEPTQLQINHGRLIWKDKDINTGTFNLKYFSGAEIFVLDSNLTGFTSDIDGDFVAWNTSSGIKIFNTKDWTTTTIGLSYNPDLNQPVSTANGKVAYARNAGGGTEIVIRNLITNQENILSSGYWNLEPSLHHGQLAWVQKFLADTTVSDIYFYDGQSVSNISNSTSAKNLHPMLKDGQVVWLQTAGSANRVKLFDGDSVITLIEDQSGSIISGYDLSDGISVASLTNLSTNNSEIKIYNSETGSFITLNDTARISSLHIDNGLICWSSGSGVQKKLMIHSIETGITDEWGSAENPVIDDEQVAWTLGESVDMLVPVTYLQLSSGNENGLPQSRFKYNDGLKVIWGNIDGSTKARLFYSDGNSTVQLTDSLIYKDFITLNAGYAIWRDDFTNLYLYDGVNPPQLIIDSLQCENMYLADGSIGFHGFRTDAGNNINQAWIYKINSAELIQLTFDTSASTSNLFTLVDGNYACWYRDTANGSASMLMLYDGVNKTRLTESFADYPFSFVDGRIVWAETINNVYQIMVYDVNTHIKTQITNSPYDNYKPVTDGSKVVWFESLPDYLLMWYYDIASNKAHKVVRWYGSPGAARWIWMSNGKVAFSMNGEVYVYDGNVLSRLTNSAPFNPNLEAYVDNDIVVWNKNNPDPNSNHYGQIFRGKLHTHVSFDADNIKGGSPLTVTFKNNSFQGVQTYFWEFGDGQTSTEKDPVHIYQSSGVYSVTLTVNGPAGSSSEKKINLIRVGEPSPVKTESGFPDKFVLYQNYPNPFNPVTTIKFDLPEELNVKLKIFNTLGEEIITLIDETLKAGTHKYQWNAKGLSSGVFYYKLVSGKYSATRSLLYLK